MSHALDVTIPQDEEADTPSAVVPEGYHYGRRRRMSPSAPDVGPAQRAVLEKLRGVRGLDELPGTQAVLSEIRNVSPTRYMRQSRGPTVSPSISHTRRAHSRCCQQNREEAERARDQFQTLQRELLSLQADVQKVREQKQAIQAEIEAAKEHKALTDAPSKPPKPQLEEYRNTIKQLHDNATAHTQTVKALKQEGLRDKEVIAALRREASEKEEELEKNEQDRLEDKNTITQLQEEIISDQDKLSELQEELVMWKEKVKGLDKARAADARKIAQLEDSLKAFDDATHLQASYNRLQEQHAAGKEELLKLQEQRDEDQEVTAKLQGEVARGLDDAVKRMEEQCSQDQDTIRGMEEQRSQDQDTIRGMEEQRLQDQDTIRGMEEQYSQEQELIHGLEKQRSEDQEAISGLEAQHSQDLEAIRCLENQVAIEQGEAGKLRQVAGDHHAVLPHLEGEVTSRDATIAKLEGELKGAKSELEGVKAEGARLAADLADVRGEVDRVHEGKEDAIAHLQGESLEDKELVLKLHDDLQKSKSEVACLSSDLTDFKETTAQHENELRQKDDAIALLETNLDRAKDLLEARPAQEYSEDDPQETIAQLESELNNAHEYSILLEQRTEDMQAKLKRLEAHADGVLEQVEQERELEEKVSRLADERDCAVEEREEEVVENRRLRDEVEGVREECGKLEKEKRALADRVAGLEVAQQELAQLQARLRVDNEKMTEELSMRRTQSPPQPYTPPTVAAYQHLGGARQGSMGVDIDANTLIVTRVVPGGPCAAAGVKKGDRIIGIRTNDDEAMQVVECAHVLRTALSISGGVAEGSTVELTVLRKGVKKSYQVMLVKDDGGVAATMGRHLRGLKEEFPTLRIKQTTLLATDETALQESLLQIFPSPDHPISLQDTHTYLEAFNVTLGLPIYTPSLINYLYPSSGRIVTPVEILAKLTEAFYASLRDLELGPTQ